MKTMYFDCACGGSGDMVVGALIDAGAAFETIRDALGTLGVAGFDLTAEKVKKHGITATQFRVHVDEGQAQPHRHLRHIVDIIEGGDLPEAVKAASITAFGRIAECEAKVHGTSIEKVHFHEVGAVDSIIDVVGAHLGRHLLGIERVVASPLNVGSGTVESAHGILPVPAPATALLLEGAACYGSEVPHELVTPTGAALIAGWAEDFGPMPEMRIDAMGYGSGTRDVEDRANVLRVLIGESTKALPATESIVVIEADIDDMNPELFPPLMADLLAKGAVDAFLTSVLGKKGRPAYLVTVLCDEAGVSDLVATIFEESTTLGVRMRQERRVCLEREWKSVDTPFGAVGVKVGRYQGRTTCTSPEFEDCRRVAEANGLPVAAVYDAARAAAVKGEMNDV